MGNTESEHYERMMGFYRDDIKEMQNNRDRIEPHPTWLVIPTNVTRLQLLQSNAFNVIMYHYELFKSFPQQPIRKKDLGDSIYILVGDRNVANQQLEFLTNPKLSQLELHAYITEMIQKYPRYI